MNAATIRLLIVTTLRSWALKIFPRISKICLKILQLSQLDCTICNRPYLCVTESAPTNKGKTSPVMEKDRFAAYVDKDGLE